MEVNLAHLPAGLTPVEFQAERRRVVNDLSAEGAWCFAFEPPVETSWPVAQQVAHIIEHGRLLACNDAMARMYGYRRASEILGERIMDLLDSMDPKNVAQFEALVAAGYRLNEMETHEIDREGNAVWFLNSVVGILDDGRLVRCWGTQLDVTAGKRLEEKSQALHFRYKQVLDHFDHSVFLKDSQFRFQVVNRKHLEMLGLKEEQVLGKTDFDFYPSHLAERYRADDELVLYQGRRMELEEPAELKGELRTIKVVKVPVYDHLGRTIAILGSAWDVTMQRALESQLRHAQMLDSIGQLAGGVANDFNNMLTAILGHLDLVLRQFPPADPLRSALELSEQAALRAADLVRKLLSFSRRMPLRLEPLDLLRFLRELAGELQRLGEPKHLLTFEAPPDLWSIRADGGQLRQVLLNLAANGREAMSEGGTLELIAENCHIDADDFRGKPLTRRGDFVCLRVIDAGPGIPVEIRHRLFEPFFTTKPAAEHALGLGLAMAYGIVERHSGWIEFASEVGKGTTFSIYLPREQAPVPALAEPPAGVQGSETILFVEDEDIVRRLGSSILTRYGYRVITASDGMEALDIFQRRRDDIDLVILDLTMPQLSGRDTYRRLRRLDPAVPVIFTSGQADELYAQAKDDPAQGCIGKPYRSEELAALVRAALDRSREEPPLP